MDNKVLVTYATRTDSTAEIAAFIGRTLTEGGLAVDVLPMQDVTDMSHYSAVVAGSAIQDKQWLPEAMQFVQTHQAALAQKPFAAFLVCMTLAMKNQQQQRVVFEWLKPVSALVKPVSEGYFAGVLNLSKVPGFFTRLGFRISVMLGVWSEGDHRDWDAIRAWAAELRPLLAA
ncbi:MAG: flavodoxin [Chloroflexota bacterium]|nr:MAG: flavodoxin [Chloroflexota bacterium]